MQSEGAVGQSPEGRGSPTGSHVRVLHLRPEAYVALEQLRTRRSGSADGTTSWNCSFLVSVGPGASGVTLSGSRSARRRTPRSVQACTLQRSRNRAPRIRRLGTVGGVNQRGQVELARIPLRARRERGHVDVELLLVVHQAPHELAVEVPGHATGLVQAAQELSVIRAPASRSWTTRPGQEEDEKCSSW